MLQAIRKDICKYDWTKCLYGSYWLVEKKQKQANTKHCYFNFLLWFYYYPCAKIMINMLENTWVVPWAISSAFCYIVLWYWLVVGQKQNLLFLRFKSIYHMSHALKKICKSQFWILNLSILIRVIAAFFLKI